jgi:hypothetical protein
VMFEPSAVRGFVERYYQIGSYTGALAAPLTRLRNSGVISRSSRAPYIDPQVASIL